MINKTICKIKGHNTLSQIMGYDPYRKEEYLYCTRCKAHLPVYNLD